MTLARKTKRPAVRGAVDAGPDRVSYDAGARRSIVRQLDESPGLRAQLQRLTGEAYADARDAALDETGLPEGAVPVECGYSWDDITSRPIEWPE